ncbi:hypothetical protein ACERNI_11055 [Camelimonas sp. ID_303_24]
MNFVPRIILALVAGVVVGGGFMAWDKYRGAEWVVSPQQIAAAKASGQAGVQSRPGAVAVRPIRSETADVLPFKWGLYGVGAALVVFVATRRRKGDARA